MAGLTFLSGSVPGDVAWANYAGTPTLCTPAGLSAATGMPFGVQLGVLPWQETQVLQLAIDYQAAYPYWSQAPPRREVPRTLSTSGVVAPPPASTADPTGTVATHRTSPLGAKMTNPPTNPPSDPAARPSVQLTTDAVVASYIHEISERHRRIDQGADGQSGAPGGR